MAVADTDVNIFEDTDNSGNGGGGGDVEIISSDNSINVDTTPDGEKDIKVNWEEMPEPEETDVKSTDGTISVEQSGQTFDLSVPLATEERNGLLSAVGKYQLDHAQTIETTEQANTANIAAGMLMAKDLEFYPEEGQMMTWKDKNGKLHLSRFEPNEPRNNGFHPYNWRTAAYDSITGSIIVESKSGTDEDPSYGKFLIARTDNNGWTWEEYTDIYSPDENWGNGMSYNGTTVFISRNRSKEIEYSTDGGGTWTRANLPTSSYWNAIWIDENGRWCFHNLQNTVLATTDFNSFTDVSSNYPAGCVCYFLPNDPSRYNLATKTSDWVCMVRETIFGLSQNIIYLKTANGWTQFSAMGAGQEVNRHFPIKIQNEAMDGNITYIDADLFVNDEYKASTIILYIDNTLNYSLQVSNDWWVYPVRCSVKEGKIYAIVSNGTNIYKAEGTIPISGTGVLLTKGDTILSGTQAVNFVPCGDGLIFTFGGVKYDHSGYPLSDFNLLLTISGTTVIATPPDFWREIPLLDENKSGLLRQNGNSVETVGLGEFLEEDNTGDTPQLKTVHSDRTTMYANYLLQNSNGICWCPVDVAYMVDGTTKIYSDEECTVEIGIVTNHSYNPHNPLDVEVSIGGVTAVYVIDQSKIPQSLATTKAVIDAMGGSNLNITDDNATTPVDTDKILYQHQNESGNVNFIRTTLSMLWAWIRSHADTLYPRFEVVNLPNNYFVGNKRFYTSPNNDRLYAADEKFNVTRRKYDAESGVLISNLSTSILFSGSYELTNGYTTAGEKEIIEISAKDGVSNIYTYAEGKLILNFYYNEFPKTNPIVRVYYGTSGNETWLTLGAPSKPSNSVFVYNVNIQANLKKIEVTIPGGTDATSGRVSPTAINYIGYISKIEDEAMVTKYNKTQDMYGTIVAPKFQTRGGTSSQVVAGDGSLLSYPSSPLNNGGEMTQQAYNDMGSHDPNTIYVITN